METLLTLAKIWLAFFATAVLLFIVTRRLLATATREKPDNRKTKSQNRSN